MKIIQVMKQPKYILIALVSALIMTSVYIYSQVLGIVQNIDLWFEIIPWYNALLFTAFAVLFGIAFAFQVYIWRQPKVCGVSKKMTSTGASSGTTFGMFMVAQCPACASLGTLFLPVGVMGMLVQFSWLINLAGIGLLLFSINYLGGFKK